jgi:hypothetical protein
VEHEQGTVWRITCRPDETLPKGRMPVMLVARNGGELPSNPAFVNFYHPEPDEVSNRPHTSPRHLQGEARELYESKKIYPVTVNKRPVLDMLGDTEAVWMQPGETVRLDLSATDPEGRAVSVYRWPDEPGRIEGNEFVFEAPDQPGSHAVHLIFSDGTGGYTGRMFKLLVSEGENRLPAPWRATVLGLPDAPGRAYAEDGWLHMESGGSDLYHRGGEQGLLVYQTFDEDREGDFDLAMEVGELALRGEGEGTPRLGMMMRTGARQDVPYFYVAARREDDRLIGEAAYRPGKWGGNRLDARAADEGEVAPEARYLRLVRRGDHMAGLVSTDGKSWTQILGRKQKFDKSAVMALALAAGGEGATARGSIVSADKVGQVPVTALSSKDRKKLKAPVTLTFLAPEGTEVAFSLDQAEESTYTDPVEITEKGRHVVRARVIQDGKEGPECVTVFVVE